MAIIMEVQIIHTPLVLPINPDKPVLGVILIPGKYKMDQAGLTLPQVKYHQIQMGQLQFVMVT